MSPPLLQVVDAGRRYGGSWRFPTGRQPARWAVRALSLDLDARESLGLVGESGSGKSTLARLICALEPPTTGRILLRGADVAALARRGFGRRVQYVLQDAAGALNPRKTVGQSLALPLQRLRGVRRRSLGGAVARLLDRVGLSPELAARYPHQLSGGQAQRVVIARAIAPEPELLVLDEPVSALDVLVQAQILALLQDLQRHLPTAFLLISHDLAVVERLCPRVAVMQDERLVEHGPREEVLRHPRHDYTRRLLAAAPRAAAAVPRRMNGN